MDSKTAKVVYCRICGIKSKKSVKIFTRKGRGMGLEQKILKCCMIAVKRSDQLPKRVCFPCIDRLDDFSQFLLHVKQAQVKLRALLKSQGVHVKDERNNELISTWKALLEHQERESASIERGKKRKRKLDVKVYDSSDSLSSDSVSEESSSESEEQPHVAATGSPPSKKLALAGSEMSSAEITLKSEKPDVMCKSPAKPSKSQQSTEEIAKNSSNVSPSVNTEDNGVNSVPVMSSVPPSGPSSEMSQMQEDEITTSQDSNTDVQESSNSLYQPATASGGINVTISPPIMFPASVSNSMIVMPGNKLESTSQMVPFYIWNVSKAGSSGGIPSQSLPQTTMKNCNSKVAPPRTKVVKEDLSSIAFSKPFILPKGAVNSTPFNERVVLLDSHSPSSLPSSKSSFVTQMSVMSSSDEPGTSHVQSDIGHVDQGTSMRQPGQFEKSLRAKVMVVDNSLAPLSLENGVPSQNSEQSNCDLNLPLSLENFSHINANNDSEMPNESMLLKEPLLCVGKLKTEMSQLLTENVSLLVTDNSKLLQHSPPTHEALARTLDETQSCSSNSSVPSRNEIIFTGDKSENLGNSRESLLVAGHQKIPVVISNPKQSQEKDALVIRKSLHSSPTSGSLANDPKRSSGDQNSLTSEVINNMVSSGEDYHSSKSSVTPGIGVITPRDPSTLCKISSSMGEPYDIVASISRPPARPSHALPSFTDPSNAPVASVGIQSTSSTSISPPALGTERNVWIDDPGAIPPLIPIVNRLLRKTSNVESENSSASVTRPISSLRTAHEMASAPLILDGLGLGEPNKLNACPEVQSIPAVIKECEPVYSISDSLEKNSNPSPTPADWSKASIADDFTINPDYSVVKCCLCSTDNYPFLITLASASDHCKFMHCDGISSFGCIKCNFTPGELKPIVEQLQILHQHISSGCASSNDSNSCTPQMETGDGSCVVEVKQEPIDVYEKAMMNLKDSLRSVNMSRFRKLITSCKTNPNKDGSDIQNSSVPSLEHSGKGLIEDQRLREASRNKFFIREGSTYICQICAKKCYSKHRVKAHIAKHKPDQRERFINAELRNCNKEAPSTKQPSEEYGANPREMVFDVLPIKIEKEDTPDIIADGSDNGCLENIYDSVIVTEISENKNKDAGKEGGSERRNRASKEQAKDGSKKSTCNASSSGIKIPFFKGEPGKFSSANKVTHMANPSDSFSFSPSPKGSVDGQEPSYVKHTRYFRSKPIVKPLYKSPTINKDDMSRSPASTSSSPGSSGVILTPKIEKVSPSKSTGGVNQCKKTGKVLSLTLFGKTSSQSSPAKENNLNESINMEASPSNASHDDNSQTSHFLVRDNANAMKVIRPNSVQELKNSLAASVSSSSPNNRENTSSLQKMNLPSKSQSNEISVNDLVLKVPFIKLKRLNFLNIDPKLSVMSHPHVVDNSVERNVMPKVSSIDVDESASDKSCGSTSKPSPHKILKCEAPEKIEDSILGW
ncbi:serine-rich adhesin for platelets-like [Hetaerina americana]|uniref:serine-rich adhesin for platelets-like n=1 Tax=Hetaerina americana TaxID=62018 RepID=UPI003A7F13F3